MSPGPTRLRHLHLVGRRGPFGAGGAFALLTIVLLGACYDDPLGPPPAGSVELAAPWVSVSPESVGMDANRLFLAGSLGAGIGRLRSLVVVREGRLAFERYYGGVTSHTRADVRSVTKSVLSTLVGIAIDAGAIDDLDQPITDFLRTDEFGLRAEHGAVTVGHLLTMASGIAWTEAGASGYRAWVTSGDPVGYLIERPVVDPPGDTFSYNSAAVHLLGLVLERAVGIPLPDFAAGALFDPLGISDVVWEPLGAGSVNGGSGIDLRPRDLARLGKLYLQEGWSGATPVVSRRWIDASTSPRWGDLGSIGPVGDLSYGLLWWLDRDRDAFFAWGFGGQFVYVAPRLDLVVVATTDWEGVSADEGSRAVETEVLGLIVERVVPAVTIGATSH